MTVMAAEAGAGAVESGAAEATAGGRAATRARGPRKRYARGDDYDYRKTPEFRAQLARQQQRTNGSRRASTAAPAPARSGQRRSRATPAIRLPDQKIGRANYQAVVLAEFVTAALLVAATPFGRKNQAGLSPYAGQDMLQLVAITVLYFLLALLAGTGGQRARLSAWFGGLILLGVGLGEATTIARTLAIFGGTPAAAATPPNVQTLAADAAASSDTTTSSAAAAGRSATRPVGQAPRPPGALN